LDFLRIMEGIFGDLILSNKKRFSKIQIERKSNGQLDIPFIVMVTFLHSVYGKILFISFIIISSNLVIIIASAAVLSAFFLDDYFCKVMNRKANR
jgi:hypothetical protein